jgi:predicted DNA binding CopG/RHH family protein
LTLSENDVALIRHYSPKASFFLRSDSANSIHGLNHIWRVMVNVILICKYYKINNYLPYLIAASIHDVRRDDDRTDDSHGQKAWEWFAQEHQDILAKLSKKDQEIIRVSVSYHNVNFNKIDSAILEKYLSVINIIKAADGLDRYRLPGKEFWPREEKMSLPGLVFMKPACLRLVVESEELSFEKGVSLDNILEVAKNIYIL